MAEKWSAKDPADVRDYQFNWADFLTEDEVITGAVVTVPGGLELVADSHTDTAVIVRLSGGLVGETYEVGCLITTTSGQVFDLTSRLKMADRIVKGEGVR